MTGQIIIKGLNFPEGPTFDKKGNLWFVEILGGNISYWNGEQLHRFDVEGTPNGIAMDKRENLWFTDSGRGEIRIFDPVSKKIETVCRQTIEGRRLKRPNDLIFDEYGNLLFSDHADGRTEPLSSVYVLPRGEKKAIVVSKEKYFTNGLAFMKNNTTLIFAETYKQKLWIGEWDAKNLELKDERTFTSTGSDLLGPDGMAIDSNENLFVAIFGQGKILQFAKNGEVENTIYCDGSRPTSCAFDPTATLGLVVTEAEKGQIISYPSIKGDLPLYHLNA